MLDFSLSEERKVFLSDVRKFARREIEPRIEEMIKRKEIPDKIIKGMAKMGLLGMCVDEEYGGAGLDAVLAGLIGEELARADTTCSIPVFFLVQCAWSYLLDKYGTKEAKEEILPGVCQGKSFLGVATTEYEPGCGSDLASMRTMISKRKGSFLVNGKKWFISGIKEVQKYGGGFVTLAKQTPKAGTRGMTLFYLPVVTNNVITPGIEIRPEKEAGRPGISFGGFFLDNVKVPSKYLLGEENKGFYIIHEGYEFARGIISLVCVGAALRILEKCIRDQLKQRVTFGKPLAKHGVIQYRVARHVARLEAARLLGLRALWMYNQEQKKKKFGRFQVSKACALAKMISPDFALEAIDDTRQWYGAQGYTEENEARRAYEGVRSFKWAEGSTEIMELIVAREIFGRKWVAYK